MLLSLCSEADAFVAVSFSSFGGGSQLAFLALGPVLDLKLAVLYAATFSRRFVPLLLLVAVPIEPRRGNPLRGAGHVIGSRTARIAAVGGWSAFFWIVWLSGDADRYLGERTLWVVPFGAVATSIAVAGLLLQSRASDLPLQPREGLGMLVLLTPIIFVLAVPGADLGASAAERRVLDPDAAARQVKARGPLSEISYVHIMAAASHSQPGVVPGVRGAVEGVRDAASRHAGRPLPGCALRAELLHRRRDRPVGLGRPTRRGSVRRSMGRCHRSARASRRRLDRGGRKRSAHRAAEAPVPVSGRRGRGALHTARYAAAGSVFLVRVAAVLVGDALRCEANCKQRRERRRERHRRD